jgi:hypothetical protein
MNLDDF